MDVLSDILSAVKLRGTLYFTTDFGPPWGIRVPPAGDVARFHLVTRGNLVVRVGRGKPVHLEAGDLVLVPRGAAHDLMDAPKTPVKNLDRVVEQSGYSGTGTFVYGEEDSGRPTRMVCGHFSFDDHVRHPFFDALPSMVVVRAGSFSGVTRMEDLVRLITREATDAGPGTDAVVTRLSEVLFIQALRVWAAESQPDAGFLAALADPQLSESLAQMHADIARGWSLESLAESAGLSRSVYASRFKQVVGMPPMTYLTLWRMQRARRLLAEGDTTMEQIADSVGYESAAAFSRVFKQHVGSAPGRYRSRFRSAPVAPAA